MVQKVQTISAVAVADLYNEYLRLKKIEDDVKAQKEHIRAVLQEYAIQYDSSNDLNRGKFRFDMDGDNDLSVSWYKKSRFRKELFLIEHTMDEYERYTDIDDKATCSLKPVKK